MLETVFRWPIFSNLRGAILDPFVALRVHDENTHLKPASDGEKLADHWVWVTLKNGGALFVGKVPNDYMIERGSAGMKTVRRLLDGRNSSAIHPERPMPVGGTHPGAPGIC